MLTLSIVLGAKDTVLSKTYKIPTHVDVALGGNRPWQTDANEMTGSAVSYEEK